MSGVYIQRCALDGALMVWDRMEVGEFTGYAEWWCCPECLCFEIVQVAV